MAQAALPSSLPLLPRDAGRALYKAQHHSLALLLGLTYRSLSALFSSSRPTPTPEQLRLLRRRFLELLERDLSNVEQGFYPRELLFAFPYRSYGSKLPEIALDLPSVIRRARQGHFSELPPEADSELYPKYYRRTFHWQTDGWFSDHSARIYDAGVEFLFGGAADVMRRMSIPPLVAATRGLRAPRIVDLACGTGRSLLALSKASPAACLTGVDLSPHYLARARKLVPGSSFVQANVEHLPAADESFDAAFSTFLFHELPLDARRNTLREARRVLRPSAVLVINDSAQLNDSPQLAPFLDSFPKNYHEPYYKGYLQKPLEELVQEEGFELLSSEPHMVSKVVVARKP